MKESYRPRDPWDPDPEDGCRARVRPDEKALGRRLPKVSIVVPFLGLTKSILRILKGSPEKELQWRL